jgi:ferredoxin
VMPRFPARQPLHHTVVRRPRSGIVQHQADTEGAPRRPASAAAGSQSVQQHRSHSPARPATAASRQAGGLGQQQQQQQQQRLLGQSFAAGSAIAGACQRPGSSNSCSSRIGGGPAQVGRPPSAGSKHVWAADAASIAGSFLASN